MSKKAIIHYVLAGFSLLACCSFFLASLITFHPSAIHAAKVFMTVAGSLWVGSAFLVLILSLMVVPLATDDELAEAKSLRRRGLWCVVPQLAVMLWFLIGGLLFARDIANMGGH